MSDVEIHLHAKFHTRDGPKKSRLTCCLCLRAEDNLLLLNSQSGAILCGECLRRTSSLLSPSKLTSATPSHQHPNNSGILEEPLRGRKSYQCIKCQQTFGSEEEIQSHVATHLLTEGATHECHLCTAKTFDSPLKLQTHLIEHTFEGCPSFRCYICSTLFTTPTALQKHILSHGHNAAPYDCPHCQLKFFFRAELENHSHTHLATNGQSETKSKSRGENSFSVQSEPNHNSNQSESNNSTLSESNNNSNQSDKNHRAGKRKRKKFFYRSDDSDEEMEEGIPIKEEVRSPPQRNLEDEGSRCSTIKERQDSGDENSTNPNRSDEMRHFNSRDSGVEALNLKNSP